MPETGDFSLSLDSSRLDRALHSLQSAMIGEGKDVTNLLIDEHRRLVRAIVNLTPPGPVAGAKRRGELAVKKDIHSLVSEAKQELIDEIGSKYGLSNIKAEITTKRGEALALEWAHLDPTGARLAEYHHSYIDKRGRIPRQSKAPRGQWISRVVVPYGVRAAYVLAEQARVGRWRAKWAYAAAQRGDAYPSWIGRHFSSVVGDTVAEFNLDDPVKGSIRFGGRGPDFRRNVRLIAKAMEFRGRLIARRVRMMLAGYRKDWEQAGQVRPRAREENAESYEEVE